MYSMLGCLFILIFGILLLVVGFGQMLLQLLFGNFRSGRSRIFPSGTSNSGHGGSRARDARSEAQGRRTKQKKNKKIFNKDEGEYVDFEDV